jgi:hypothetical protein
MSRQEFKYHKVNFYLSVIGFIGSLGFYYGVLVKVYSPENEQEKQQQIDVLKEQNAQLLERLKACQKSK